MQRRTFIKQSALMGTTMMFPQLAEADMFSMKNIKKAIEVAFYASKLNPVRLVAGLVFDHFAEVYVEPMAKKTFNNFLDGKTVPKSSLSYYTNTSSELKVKKEIYVEPYKASIVTYSRNEKTNYYLNQQKEIQIELIKKFDKERFAQIHQYFKENKIKVKQYGRETISTVGSDLTPTDLFDIDYIAYGKHGSEIHIQKLLEATNNSVFEELVV
jgi:hypothetical protein